MLEILFETLQQKKKKKIQVVGVDTLNTFVKMWINGEAYMRFTFVHVGNFL